VTAKWPVIILEHNAYKEISYNKETKRNKKLDYIILKADHTGRLNYIINI
jgi:hypothetical protein